MIRDTSIDAYHDSVKDKSEPDQANRVLNVIIANGGATINHISRILDLPPGRISARVRKLVKDDLIYEQEERVIDSITGKKNIKWKLIKGETQMSLSL